jgi:Peptidase_C39 like family
MAGRSKILPVPYFAQPTDVTCQSTCLKMMAAYLERSVVLESTGAATCGVQEIWQDINTGAKRPVQATNNHKNMQWWLQARFPTLKFEYLESVREDRALQEIIHYIDGDFPVIVSVSHSNVDGHIILAVGYENYEPNLSSPDFKLVVHDPYGRLDPSLQSPFFGWKRWQGGMSVACAGGERAPGANVRLSIQAAGRRQLPHEAYARAINRPIRRPAMFTEVDAANWQMFQESEDFRHRVEAIDAARRAREQLGLYYLISGHR